MSKKEDERQFLDLTIKSAKGLRGTSKQIINYLSAPDFSDANTERPDFIKLLESKDKRKKDTLIGIEHFRVDHQTKKIHEHGDTYDLGISNAGALKKARRVQQEYSKSTAPHDVALSDAANKLKDIIPDLFTSLAEATYPSFVEAFKTHFANHASNINEYYEKLRRISNGEYDIKLAFLIEIHTSFSTLFLHKGEDTLVNHHENALIFDDYIRVVEKYAGKSKLDYVIFSTVGTNSFRNANVVAVKVKGIRDELKRRHIPVYKYCGEDASLQPFQPIERNHEKSVSTVEDDGVNFTFRFGGEYEALPEQARLYYSLHTLYNMMMFMTQGYPCAADMTIERNFEVLRDFIVKWDWTKTEYGTFILPTIDPKYSIDIMEKYDLFHDKMVEQGLLPQENLTTQVEQI